MQLRRNNAANKNLTEIKRPQATITVTNTISQFVDIIWDNRAISMA